MTTVLVPLPTALAPITVSLADPVLPARAQKPIYVLSLPLVKLQPAYLPLAVFL